jgi:hypothetical protein
MPNYLRYAIFAEKHTTQYPQIMPVTMNSKIYKVVFDGHLFIPYLIPKILELAAPRISMDYTANKIQIFYHTFLNFHQIQQDTTK